MDKNKAPDWRQNNQGRVDRTTLIVNGVIVFIMFIIGSIIGRFI